MICVRIYFALLPGSQCKSFKAPTNSIIGSQPEPSPKSLTARNFLSSSLSNFGNVSHIFMETFSSVPQTIIIKSLIAKNCAPLNIQSRTVAPGTISAKFIFPVELISASMSDFSLRLADFSTPVERFPFDN